MSPTTAGEAFERIAREETRDAASMEEFAALATAPGAIERVDVATATTATRPGRGAALVDVRSPVEYERGRVPGAVNVPLFENDVRARVGLLYKTKGRGEAMVAGMDAVAPRLEDIVRAAAEACASTSAASGEGDGEACADVYVMCFRGGMRSSCVGWLLTQRLTGKRVRVVDGGYKGFRKWALERCGPVCGLPAPRVCVVGGRTGVGKTRALLALRAQGEQVIDLEGLANHAGSAFGWVGREPQPTSEHYSNLVACEWHELDPNRWVYIEDEGPHVGRCSVDPLLFERMRNAPLVLRMVASRDVRLRTLVKDYATSELRSDPQWLPTMRESVDKLAKRLGGDRVREIQSKLDAGDFAAVAAGLLEYYDGLYDKHLMSKRKDLRHAASDKSSPKTLTPTAIDRLVAETGSLSPLSTPVSDDARSVVSRGSASSVEDEARAGVVVDVHCHPDVDGALDERALVRDILCAVALFDARPDHVDDDE